MIAADDSIVDRSLVLPPGFSLRCFGAVDSTMTEARSLAEGGAPSGVVVWAEEQTQGRGRLGRVWASAPGNLYTTTVLRPQAAAGQVAALGFATALAVGDAVESVLGSGAAQLKWPNDVLVDGAKICGILLEISAAAATGPVDWVLIGAGINVLHHPEIPGRRTTSVQAQGGAVELAVLCERYIAALAHWYARWQGEGFAAVRAAWLARAHAVGVAMRVRIGTTEVDGHFAGLDADGALLLRDLDGRVRTVTAGDVFTASSGAAE
jgi:BirA family transcriptional regulator, biotin operon repressor / biotin---[acetyl-CoA-carboxylase] ligase